MLDPSGIVMFVSMLVLFGMVMGVVIAVCAAKILFYKRHHKYSVPAAIVLVLGWYADIGIRKILDFPQQKTLGVFLRLR